MANRKLTVNISVNSEIDAKKILEKLYAEIAKEIEVKVEVAKKEESLNVGDYAKVVRKDKFNVGDVVYIFDEDPQHFSAQVINDLIEYWHYADKTGELIKATDEEVAEAKAQQAEVKRWSAIGRKPGEYKKGDIVKYKSDGEICEVFGIKANGSAEVESHISGMCTEDEDIELVTPVEARFDR